MKTRFTLLSLTAAALAGAILGGCAGRSSAGTGTFLPSAAEVRPLQNAATQSFVQIELLARPAVKEAFEAFKSHDTTNRSEPYADPVLHRQIGSFTRQFRSATIAKTLQAVLYPNEMKLDLSQNTTTAAYLGVESGGATGSKFGGRALSDDIIDLSLGAIFGNTLVYLGAADDGKELPCLTTDNVAYSSTTGSSFPFVQAPI
ncbi:MAG TPA: DUF4331 family protein [Candidatus Baltobacteraceae bacterium]|nr:DUF4331 family protein [Candidatus Baltobacteraceae bacterium]